MTKKAQFIMFLLRCGELMVKLHYKDEFLDLSNYEVAG